MTDPVSRALTAIEAATGRKPSRSGSGWQARCPAHDDRNPSLSVSEGDGGKVLFYCHAGCPVEAITKALGLTMAELTPRTTTRPANPPKPSAPKRSPSKTTQSPLQPPQAFQTLDSAVAALESKLGPHTAQWTYTTHDGAPVGAVFRWNRLDGGKDIRQLSRSKAGWSLTGMVSPRPLFSLPTLADAKRVFVVEGEPAADALRSIGVTVTTSAGGSKAAAKSDWSALTGKDVAILPDNDDAGRKYAADVVKLLGKLDPAPTIRVVALPDLPERGDAVEYLAACRAEDLDDSMIRQDLAKLVEAIEPAAAPGRPGTSRPVLIRVADVAPRPIQWLWQPRMALGKLVMLPGDPGLGKSFITLDMAARVSTGTPWPDTLDTANPAGGVVLLSAEDDVTDTIRPRLDAAGADVSRINVLASVQRTDIDGETRDDHFDLTADLPALEDAIQQTPNCRLVIVDPITAYLGGTDSHKNAEVRAVLAKLSEVAARFGVALVAVTHLNKASTLPAMYRAMGSLAFVAAARSVWAVVRDNDDETGRRRLFVPIKNNIGDDRTGLAYSLESDANGTARVAWEPEPIDMTADDAMNAERSGGTDDDDAETFLREALADGKQPANEILRQARANGFTDKAARKAFKSLGGGRRREGFGAGGTWYWSLTGSGEASNLPNVGNDPPSPESGDNASNGASAENGTDDEVLEWTA